MSAVATMPSVSGRLTPNAPLAPLVWFKSGGTAEWLLEPKDEEDLVSFLRELDPQVPVMALGLGSNLIVRDGGVPGVVVRLGKPFSSIERLDETTLRCGGGASGILVSSTAREAGISGLEFLRGILERRMSAKNLSGPIGIAQYATEAAQEGPSAFLMLMSVVSARPGPKARKKSSSPTRRDAVPATTISPAVATIGVTRIVAARADSAGERPSRSERRIPER